MRMQMVSDADRAELERCARAKGASARMVELDRCRMPNHNGVRAAGPKPLRPGDAGIGLENAAEPVTGLAAKFSHMTRIAPSPLGSETVGAWIGPAGLSSLADSVVANVMLDSGGFGLGTGRKPRLRIRANRNASPECRV
jgi:hypothetical protein